MQAPRPCGLRPLVLQIAVLVTTVYAFVHAALQRPDAYTAAEKLTKPVWLVILGVGVLLALVLGITGWRSQRSPPASISSTSGPRIHQEIQGKSR